MNQSKKQISEKEETTSKPPTNLLAFNGFSQLKKLLRGLILLSLILIVNLVATVLLETPSKAMGRDKDEETISLNTEATYINNVRNVSNEKLVKEVDIYMKYIAPTTKLKASVLVPLCKKYNMDIIFVLAQGILESHLGTKGIAVQTNSVWNVGTFDSGIIHYTYKDPNESIEPYLKLLRSKYLIKIPHQGDTISRDLKNLIQDRGFINSEGKRYATSHIYENSLRNMMIKVNMESSISLYQGISDLPDAEILSFFSPVLQKQDTTNYLSNL